MADFDATYREAEEITKAWYAKVNDKFAAYQDRDTEIKQEQIMDDINDVMTEIFDSLNDIVGESTDEKRAVYVSVLYPAFIVAYMLAIANGHSQHLSEIGRQYVATTFVHYFLYPKNICGVSVRNWDYMLSPELEGVFNQISPHTLAKLQNEAAWRLTRVKRIIEDEGDEYDGRYEELVDHLNNIVNGVIPFGYESVGTDEKKTETNNE